MAAQKRLGELLVEMGFIDGPMLQHALEEQTRSGRRLGKILCESGAVSEDRLVRALSLQLGLDICDPINVPVHPRVLGLVTPEIAHGSRVVPVALKKDEVGLVLFLATADPLDKSMVERVRAHVGSEHRLRWLLAGETEIDLALARHFGLEAPPPHFPPEQGAKAESVPAFVADDDRALSLDLGDGAHGLSMDIAGEVPSMPEAATPPGFDSEAPIEADAPVLAALAGSWGELFGSSGSRDLEIATGNTIEAIPMSVPILDRAPGPNDELEEADPDQVIELPPSHQAGAPRVSSPARIVVSDQPLIGEAIELPPSSPLPRAPWSGSPSFVISGERLPPPSSEPDTIAGPAPSADASPMVVSDAPDCDPGLFAALEPGPLTGFEVAPADAAALPGVETGSAALDFSSGSIDALSLGSGFELEVDPPTRAEAFSGAALEHEAAAFAAPEHEAAAFAAPEHVASASPGPVSPVTEDEQLATDIAPACEARYISRVGPASFGRDPEALRRALEHFVEGGTLDQGTSSLLFRVVGAILLEQGLFDAERVERVLARVGDELTEQRR
jgi:hypothetical protein